MELNNLAAGSVVDIDRVPRVNLFGSDRKIFTTINITDSSINVMCFVFYKCGS